ncbi:MAG: T9SS type A sorting domain-containing protein [Bacteroidetes bacterium]|nr:T9SS type A sorting domain-containing protein [Bacteroidota bacterium]
MRKIAFFSLFFILGLLVFPLDSIGQSYGNEWIKKDQKYFKIKIAKEGIYRIDYTTFATILFQNGIDLSTINPKKIQIFNNGEEQSIYLKGEDDGIFNFNDFIEFYAKPNDGKLDRELFYTDPVNDPLSDAQSMYSDTAAYFITFLPNTSPFNGKRFTLSQTHNLGNYTVESYFKYTSSIYLSETYYYGHPIVISNVALYYPEYTEAEGWLGNRFGFAPSVASYRTFSLSTPAHSLSGFDPVLEFKVVSSSENIANPDHNLRVGVSANNVSFNTVYDSIFDGFGVIKRRLSFPKSYISGANTSFVKMEAINIPGVALQAFNPSYATLMYARNFDMTGFTSIKGVMEASATSKEITWINYGIPGQKTPIVYDITNNRRITPVFGGGQTFSYVNPPSSKEAEFVIYDSTEATSITQIEAIDFPDIDAAINNTQFLIITHQKLMGNEATDYLNYRKTSFAANMYSVQQLYNTFSYGIEHPIAIRRFVKLLIDKATTMPPEYLLFLGRGIQPDLLKSAAMKQLNLIPILGSPASDILYTAGLGGKSSSIPYLATGRVSVDKPSDIGTYLQKLIEQEQSPNAHWKKRVMHLGGGNDGSESKIIRSYLEYFSNYPIKPPFGGKVLGYYRSASDVAVDINIRDNSVQNINDGLSLITFLGHGSATVLDVDIGDTTDYSNKGKLPVMYFNGCRAGNPAIGFNNGSLFYGERMIRAKDKGAIVFIGQSSISELGTLGGQIRSFYDNMFDKNFGKSVGKILNLTIEENLNYNNPLSRLHNTFIFYQGDPAYTIYNPPLPDYFVTPSSLFLDPENTNALNDSFNLGIIVGNIGRYIESDSFDIHIKRTWPSNSKIEDYTIKVPAVSYLDTIYFTFKTKDIATTGNNHFEVELNPNKTIVESNYSNNKVTWDKYIEGNGISLLYPRRFAIHNQDDSVTLVAQSLNLLKANNQFIFELDTTPEFNSPWLKRTMPAINSGNIAEWTVPILSIDSQVYYWRGRLNLPTDQGGFWEERSFIYIKNGHKGWSQSDFPQFYPSSQTHKIILNKEKQQFEFANTERFVWVDTRVNTHVSLGVKFGGYLSQDVNPKAGGSFIAVLLDRNTLEQFLDANFYPKCWLGATWPPFQATQQYAYYCFANTNSDIAEFNALINDVPEGTYVAFFTRYDAQMSTWNTQLKQTLNMLGAQSFEGYPKNQASFVMIGCKGWAPGTAYENISHLTDSATMGYAAVEGKILGRYDQGSVTSEPIGPASEWNTAFFDWKPMWGTPSSSDDIKFSVYGIDSSKNTYLLMQNISPSTVDLSSIDANRYPFIQLKADFKDITDRSAPQIRHWMVTFEDRPEGTINTSQNYSFHNDTLQEGDSFRIKIGFQNISDKNMDSILYHFQIIDLSNQNILLTVEQKGNPIKHGEFVIINQPMSTRGLSGHYAANIFFNPNMEQPEISLANNYLSIPFQVITDNLNPLLDVTFDGRHIMNGEIVSPNPLILITSKDENRFLLQTDTGGFEILLRMPGTQNFIAIDKSLGEITFKPAIDANNVATIEYRPVNLADGKYTIKVQSKDLSGNNAGREFYTIDFVVINESTITNFYPYPNPFTTQMRFVFTLTGKEIPDDISVKIMTVSGKVVREISKEELGNIRVGNNISDFAWDGTDQFGDRLANGVYLYQVIVKNHNETLKHRDSAGDNTFVKGTGKIYLLR